MHPKLPGYLAGLSLANLARFHFRVWRQIDRRYGPVSWDWPTLHATFPEFALTLRAIAREAKSREQDAA